MVNSQVQGGDEIDASHSSLESAGQLAAHLLEHCFAAGVATECAFEKDMCTQCCSTESCTTCDSTQGLSPRLSREADLSN